MAISKKRAAKFTGLLAILVAPFLAYLLWPINTDNTLILPDGKLLEGKRAFLAGTRPGESGQKTNVIILFADDLGKYDISLYGGQDVPTPHIDSLAASGVTFTDGYVTAPICSPSRAGLLTGRYQQRFGHELQPGDRYPSNRLERALIKQFVLTGDWKLNEKEIYPSRASLETQGLPQSEITFADLAKTQGYSSGAVGKWHLGHTKGFTPPTRRYSGDRAQPKRSEKGTGNSSLAEGAARVGCTIWRTTSLKQQTFLKRARRSLPNCWRH